MNAAQQMYNDAIDRFKGYIDSIDDLTDSTIVELYKATFGYYASLDKREYYSPSNSSDVISKHIVDCRYISNDDVASGLTKKQVKDFINKFLTAVPKGYEHFQGLTFIKVTPKYTREELVTQIKQKMETMLLMTVTKGNRQAMLDLLSFSNTFDNIRKK